MSLGDLVNGWIDGLFAAADRLLQLPSFAVLLLLGGLGALTALAIARLTRRPERAGLRRALYAVEGLLVALALCWTLDRRLATLEQTVRELAVRHPAAAATAAPTAATTAAPTVASPASSAGAGPHPSAPAGEAAPASASRSLQFDATTVRSTLERRFGECRLDPLVIDDAIDFVDIACQRPMAHGYLAIVDLQRPGVEIRLGTDLQRKSLTSTFARQTGCTLALNGEAGLSPFPESGLGSWRGHLVHRGEVLLKEQDGNPRPFLAFDAHNHASYRPMSATDRGVGATPWHVLWGRFDALVDGQVQEEASGNRQPRTAMGIDRDGRRLFLLVIDGRQPRYSMGMTRSEVGALLQAFGARDAMLCDEGGSSCLWLDFLGGIVNSPSDGQERVTYTHFGIARAAGH